MMAKVKQYVSWLKANPVKVVFTVVVSVFAFGGFLVYPVLAWRAKAAAKLEELKGGKLPEAPKLAKK